MQSQRIKIAQIAEFTTSKSCTFNNFFHFLRLNWSLHDVKHTILVLQKQPNIAGVKRGGGGEGEGGGGDKKEKNEKKEGGNM